MYQESSELTTGEKGRDGLAEPHGVYARGRAGAGAERGRLSAIAAGTAGEVWTLYCHNAPQELVPAKPAHATHTEERSVEYGG